MKAISNTSEIPTLLQTENKEWKQVVYAQTGVIVIIDGKNGILFSKCGYIDLDHDAEYCSINGQDCTQYTEITCIAELIEYIKKMDGYKEFLIDTSYGRFSKAELFWSIYARIICPEENQRRKDGSVNQDWGLYSIGSYAGHADLYVALVDYDSGEIWIDIGETSELNDVLSEVLRQMNEATADIDNISAYKLYINNAYSVPDTYSDLMEQLSDGGQFEWLCH